MKRGEVWWASLPGPMGRRPVLVIQSNAFNASRIRSVVVVLITSQLAWEAAPGNVRLAPGDGGVPRASVVNVSQICTIERACLTQRLGVLSQALRDRVDAGVRLVLELPGGAAGGLMETAAEYATAVG
jgi:mRNA interferase MazF